MQRTKKEKKLKRVPRNSLAKQMKRHTRAMPEKKSWKGNTEIMISTGSTLLDLAICGTRKRGGGIPGGILLEAFGPNSSGKTVLLCEIGGAIQRQGGDIQFNDPEARLNKNFAKMFDLNTDDLTIEEPDTVTEMFNGIRDWRPRTKAKVHGCLTDSLAALSTKLEMKDAEGDKMGMRRAKEFSEGLRKTCRILKQNNWLMVCSNQIRENAGAGLFEEKVTAPGGKAIGFYASIRLRFGNPIKVKKKLIIKNKEIVKVIGIKTRVEVYKNSCDVPYRTVDVYIQFDYGVDNTRANLQYLKDFRGTSIYCIDEVKLDKSMEKSIKIVERENIEEDLQEAVIDLWEEINDKFKVERKKKVR